jgi:hypothetical protein
MLKRPQITKPLRAGNNRNNLIVNFNLSKKADEKTKWQIKGFSVKEK